ncbi:MAG: hypothetical protein HW416_19 [Chloroflexi bacterium]|nr:hypothetical protein [Chloroflexota bacterium]
MRKVFTGGAFELTATAELKDALRGLVLAFPAAHSARTEIVRFARRLDDGPVRVAFSVDPEVSELVHIRHPLVLLTRWLAREPLPDIPYCRGSLAGGVESPTVLVWAIGSLEGYANRAELMCAAVNCNTGKVSAVRVEEAQKWLRDLVPHSTDFNFDPFVGEAEGSLLAQFQEIAERFNVRNALLAEKAKHVLVAQAERKLDWLRRQLGRSDLKQNIRNLYRGWSQHLEGETNSKIEEIELKVATRSSLQVIGVVFLSPRAQTTG